MSSQAYIPIQNDYRYEVNIENYHQKQFILYSLRIMDLAIGTNEIKKLHQGLAKKYKQIKEILPELPKTNSFGLWNKTNKDHRKIEERRRELQYYFKKILNNHSLRCLNEIKTLLINASKATNRTQSTLNNQVISKTKRVKSLPIEKQKNQY